MKPQQLLMTSALIGLLSFPSIVLSEDKPFTLTIKNATSSQVNLRINQRNVMSDPSGTFGINRGDQRDITLIGSGEYGDITFDILNGNYFNGDQLTVYLEHRENFSGGKSFGFRNTLNEDAKPNPKIETGRYGGSFKVIVNQCTSDPSFPQNPRLIACTVTINNK